MEIESAKVLMGFLTCRTGLLAAVLERNKPRSRIGLAHVDGTNRQSRIKAGQSVRLLRVNSRRTKTAAASSYVRFAPKAANARSSQYVRLVPKADIRIAANSFAIRSLVGAGEQRWRDQETENRPLKADVGSSGLDFHH
jgi:hypothetical protein